jgi:hypothetical protein
MATLARPFEPIVQDEKISAYGQARATIKGAPLSSEELRKIDAYWRASLYLSLGMLYLKENPLLRVNHSQSNKRSHDCSAIGVPTPARVLSTSISTV